MTMCGMYDMAHARGFVIQISSRDEVVAKPVGFRTMDDAVEWLQRLGLTEKEAIARLTEASARHDAFRTYREKDRILQRRITRARDRLRRYRGNRLLAFLDVFWDELAHYEHAGYDLAHVAELAGLPFSGRLGDAVAEVFRLAGRCAVTRWLGLLVARAVFGLTEERVTRGILRRASMSTCYWVPPDDEPRDRGTAWEAWAPVVFLTCAECPLRFLCLADILREGSFIGRLIFRFRHRAVTPEVSAT